MYLVFSENSFTLLGKEYFGQKGSKIIGYHDPNLASHFTSKKKAEEFCSLFDYPDRKIEKVEKHLEDFKNCNYIYREIPLIDNSLNVKYDPNIHNSEDILKWRMRIAKAPERSVTQDVYGTWPDLYSVFTHLHSIESFFNKNYSEKFYSVSIMTPKTGDYETFRKEFGMVLDFCTLVENGRKVFRIFDHELSEYETRSLHFGGEEDCIISSGRYDRFKGNLKECFEKMRREFWY